MEECCAVCAEPLEWVAYGPCGHREVCFTCTARMRFVLEDKKCCICKQDCPSVYVTKALGDYTKVLTDFSGLEELLHRKEKGGVHLWYESNVQAYFDDEEPFRTIKAMCRLYCSVCENAAPATPEEPSPKGSVKKGYMFKSLEILRRHLFSTHRLVMCELCLTGRKIFICEQNLFTKTQLERHADKGDSEVDGTEEERGGFTGHPMCEFCRKRFYGENELYQHMSTEHYTCHLCQRARPGHFEYYRNYDDLEMHFRDKHSLCEHSDCLNKKFVVFTSEAELKRHNATAHGGNMSRSQRNAALQIPVSFQFRRPGQDSGEGSSSDRRGYGRGSRGRGRGSPNVNVGGDSLDVAVQASLEQAVLDDAVRESAAMAASVDSGSVRSGTAGTSLEGSNAFAALDTEVSEGEVVPSRYASAVSGTGPSSLVDSAFPPLPGVSKKGKHKPKNHNGPASMAALLGGGRLRGGLRVLNAADPRLSVGSSSSRPSSNGDARAGSWASNNARPATAGGDSRPSGWATPTPSRGFAGGGSSSDGEGFPRTSAVSEPGPPSAAGGASDGVSASNVVRQISPSNSQRENEEALQKLNMEQIRVANKALIERIQAGLEGNEQQFSDFKEVSTLFRKGEMSAFDYDGHITRLGISYLVPELARLLPDPVKRGELLDAHKAGLARNQAFPPVASSNSSSGQVSRSSTDGKKGKEREGGSASTSAPARQVASPSSGEVEVLSQDGYRRARGKVRVEESNPGSSGEGVTPSQDRKSQILVKATQSMLESSDDPVNPAGSSGQAKGWTCEICTLENVADASRCAACGIAGTPRVSNGMLETGVESGGNDKRKKKVSKFQRVRLGDGSAAALLDSVNPNPWGPSTPDTNNPAPPANGGRSFGRGAWNNGGGQRLLSNAQRESVIESAWGRK